MCGLMERLGLPIPPFTLLRRARLAAEHEGESLLIKVTGLDPQEDTPYSFIKVSTPSHLVLSTPSHSSRLHTERVGGLWWQDS